MIGPGVEAYRIHYHEDSWLELRLKQQDALRGHSWWAAGQTGDETETRRDTNTTNRHGTTV